MTRKQVDVPYLKLVHSDDDPMFYGVASPTVKMLIVPEYQVTSITARFWRHIDCPGVAIRSSGQIRANAFEVCCSLSTGTAAFETIYLPRGYRIPILAGGTVYQFPVYLRDDLLPGEITTLACCNKPIFQMP